MLLLSESFFFLCVCLYVCACWKKWKISTGRELLVKVDKDTKKSDGRTMGFEKRPKVVITKWKCLSSWETLVSSRWMEKSVTDIGFSARETAWEWKKKKFFATKWWVLLEKGKYFEKSVLPVQVSDWQGHLHPTSLEQKRNRIHEPTNFWCCYCQRSQDLTIPSWEFYVQTIKREKSQSVAFGGMHKATEAQLFKRNFCKIIKSLSAWSTRTWISMSWNPKGMHA